MKCPYCGNDMVMGFIQCRDGVYWSEKERPVAALPILGGEMIYLCRDESGAFSGNSAQAYCCKTCKKIVIDYGE